MARTARSMSSSPHVPLCVIWPHWIGATRFAGSLPCFADCWPPCFAQFGKIRWARHELRGLHEMPCSSLHVLERPIAQREPIGIQHECVGLVTIQPAHAADEIAESLALSWLHDVAPAV